MNKILAIAVTLFTIVAYSFSVSAVPITGRLEKRGNEKTIMPQIEPQFEPVVVKPQFDPPVMKKEAPPVVKPKAPTPAPTPTSKVPVAAKPGVIRSKETPNLIYVPVYGQVDSGFSYSYSESNGQPSSYYQTFY